MKILAVNAGSSSLKFKLYNMPNEEGIISGVFERIGIEGSFYTIKYHGDKISKEINLEDHEVAFKILIDELLLYKVINSLDEIRGVGHRIVQGGSYFDSSVLVNDDVLDKITELSPLAPLHNPAALIGIRAAMHVIPNAKHVCVFDTSFHQTLSKDRFMYALPYEWYTNYQVRKYGAHGTSHKYVSHKLMEILKKDNSKIIVCHLGNGASVSAVLDGKCVDTSMGLTPNAGLIMGTRCGDIDATIIPYIMRKTNLTADEIDSILNKKSGFLGISGVSSDARDITSGVENNDERCKLALDMFVDRVVDYIARYYFLLKGVDAIAFTAGIGENSKTVRRKIVEKLNFLGVFLDEDKNNNNGELRVITTNDSTFPCYVVPTDEEVMIAKDTFDLI